MAPLPFSVKGGHRCPRPPLLANSVAHRFDSVLVGAHGNFSALELRYPFLTFSAAGSGYLLPSQAVCLFLSLLPLTWIDYSMNSTINLAQSCIRDPRPLRWFVFTYILGFNYSTSLKSATGIWLRHSLTLFNNYLQLEVQTGRLAGPSLSLHSLSSMWAVLASSLNATTLGNDVSSWTCQALLVTVSTTVLRASIFLYITWM